MPILFRALPKEELGIWLLLGQSWATLGILDLGFGVTLTRQIAFAKGKSGSDPECDLNETSLQEIADLVMTGQRIYRYLSVISFVIAFGLGALYLNSLTLEHVPVQRVWIAWGILCLSFSINTLATPWACLLQGVGYVGWDAIIVSFVNTLTLIGQIAVALLGGGLVSLAVVAVAGAFTQRLAIYTFAFKKRPELLKMQGMWKHNQFKLMVPLASRAWLTASGAAMILYTDQFIIASFQGTAELPVYRASWILVHNLTVLAVTFAMASGVFISHLWQDKNYTQVHRILERNTRIGWLIMLTTTAVLVFGGEELFTLWLGPGNFVGYGVLMVFVLTETLETQSYVIASTSRATGDEAFAFSSLAAGVIKITSSVYLAHQFGLLGIALGTTIALLLTNHWYIPKRGLERLNYSKKSYLAKVVLPCIAVFCALSGLLSLMKLWTHVNSPMIHLCLVLVISGVCFIVALWFLVMEPMQRSSIISRIQTFHA